MYKLFGVLAVGLGLLGAFLPILPTTPFVLVAAYFFARSSERLYTWLLNHKRLGPRLRHWQTHRSLSKNEKVWALILVYSSMGALAYARRDAWYMLVIAALVVAFETWLMVWKIKTHRPRRSEAAESV